MKFYDCNRKDLIEEVAQMLYDKAEHMTKNEDEARTEYTRNLFEARVNTYCAAAEYVRQMNDLT